MSEDPKSPPGPVDRNLERQLKLFLPSDSKGGIRSVLASFPIGDRERSLLRALSESKSRYQLRVREESHIDGSYHDGEDRFWAITNFVWPPGSPPPAKGAQTEEQLLRELTCGAPGLVVREGQNGRSSTLSELFPGEMRHVGKVLHLDGAHGVKPQRGEKRRERSSAPPPIPLPRRPGNSEPPPAA